MVQRVFLVRHGQTAWSLSGRHTGRTDIALTPHGEAEVRRLAPWVAGLAFSAVLTSPLQRARQTAMLAGFGAAREILPDLAEWDYGDYEGELTMQIHQARPAWNVFIDGCPGGESPADVAARADRVIARLGALHGNVAICSHGHFLCALAARWAGWPVPEARHFYLNTASLSVLGFQPSQPTLPAIMQWNATPPNLEHAPTATPTT